ncbi:MAG: hypothetical protein WCV90_09195 [Candidatus Woesearchaeota archaeon]|jgi:hypothetical protein
MRSVSQIITEQEYTNPGETPLEKIKDFPRRAMAYKAKMEKDAQDKTASIKHSVETATRRSAIDKLNQNDTDLATRRIAGEFGEGDRKNTSDPEAQSNQKPLAAQEPASSNQVQEPSFLDKVTQKGKDIASDAKDLTSKAGDMASKAGKGISDFYGKNQLGVNTALGAAAVGGLGYAAYKALKNRRKTQKEAIA